MFLFSIHKTRAIVVSTLIALYLFLMPMFGLSLVQAAAGINSQLPFQGKVVNKTTGTNVVNGSYTFVFRIYSAASGGSAIWTETKSLTVTNGMFYTYLGDTTALPGSIDFNSDSLYLGIEYNADGEMTPRVRFGAVPYALNAAKVSGLTVTHTTGTLTVQNGKTVSLSDNFTTNGAFPLTFNTTAATSLWLPSTGTVVTTSESQVLSNKTISSTGLIFGGAGPADIIKSGTLVINSTALTLPATTLSSGSALRLTGGAGSSSSTANGTIWYNQTSNKFEVVENGAIKVLCNTTDLGCSASANPTLNLLLGATATNSINHANFAQIWSWNTLTSQTGLSLSSSSLTSGAILLAESTATSNMTGSVASVRLAGTTGSSTNTGSVFSLTNEGEANANTTLALNHYAKGSGNLALRVNDELNDTTPVVVDGRGRLGVGTFAPTSLLQVGSVANRGNTDIYGQLTLKGFKQQVSLPGIIDLTIYDTSLDSDAGKWVDSPYTSLLSWASEAVDDGPDDPCSLTTDDRCGTATFPSKAIIATTASGLYIFDAQDNSLWMKFSQQTNAALGADANNNPSGVDAKNGVIYVGTNGTSATGMYAIDFINDRMYQYSTSQRTAATTGISTRNGTVSYTSDAQTKYALASIQVHDVSIAVTRSTSNSSSTTLIAAATPAGVSLVNLNTRQAVTLSASSTNEYVAVKITSAGRLYTLNKTTSELNLWEFADSLQRNSLPHAYYTNTNTSNPPLAPGVFSFPSGKPDILEVVERSSFISQSFDVVYVGTSLGLTELHYNGTLPSVARYISKDRATEYLIGTSRYFNMDESSGNLASLAPSTLSLYPVGTPTYGQSGLRGKSVSLSGTSGFCSKGAGSSCAALTDYQPGTNNFMVSLWFKRTQAHSGTEVLVDFTKNASGTHTGGFRVVYNSNVLQFQVDDDATAFPEVFASSQLTNSTHLSDDQWHHLLVLRQTNTAMIFLDGVLGGSTSFGSTTGTLSFANILSVGGECSGTNCTSMINGWKGQLDDLSLSINRASNQLFSISNPATGRLTATGKATARFPELTATATTFSSTSVGSSSLSLSPNSMVGSVVWIVSGTGQGQSRTVTANTSNSLTVASSWGVTPDSTSVFKLNHQGLYGTSNDVIGIGVGNGILSEEYPLVVGTAGAGETGAVTRFDRGYHAQASDVYLAKSEFIDQNGNPWGGGSYNNGSAIDISSSLDVIGHGGGFASLQPDLSIKRFNDRFDKFAQLSKVEQLAKGVSSLSLQMGVMGGADLAEFYRSAQPLSAGEIVMLQGEVTDQVMRTTSPYERKTLGVVASAPGLILGQESGDAYPVALVGRVPVKVTTEGGDIKKGDLITSSSTHGYGMKATQAGVVVGIALQDLSAELMSECPSDRSVVSEDVQCGQVMIFVNLGHSLGVPIETLLASVNTPFEQVSGVHESSLHQATQEQQAILGYLRTQLGERSELATRSAQALRVDRVQAQRDVISPTIITDLLLAKRIKADTIEGFELYTNKIDSLSTQLQTQLTSAQTTLATLSAQLQQSQGGTQVGTQAATLQMPSLFLRSDKLETQGLLVYTNSEFRGDASFQKLARFFELVEFMGDVKFLKKPLFTQDTVGQARVEKSASSVLVKFAEAYQVPPIINISLGVDWASLSDEEKLLLSAALKSGQLQYYISSRERHQFEIQLTQPAPVRLDFSWTAWAVDEKAEVSTSVQTSPAPSLAPSLAPSFAPSFAPSATPTPTPLSTLSTQSSTSPTPGVESPAPSPTNVVAPDEAVLAPTPAPLSVATSPSPTTAPLTPSSTER